MSSFYGNSSVNGGGGGPSENTIREIVSEYITDNSDTITPLLKITIRIGYNSNNEENSYNYDTSYNDLVSLLGNATDIACVLRIVECTPGEAPTQNNEISSITTVGYVSKSVRGILDNYGRLTIGANIGKYIYDTSEKKWTYNIIHHEFVVNDMNWILTHYMFTESNPGGSAEIFVGSTTPSGYSMWIDPEGMIADGNEVGY